jgi:hypothetical protein
MQSGRFSACGGSIQCDNLSPTIYDHCGQQDGAAGRTSMKQRWIALSLLMFIAIVVMAGCAAPPTAVTFTTPYQAVLLSNNSVYYGKLAGFGTPNPVLTEVFYIVTQTNPETKQVSNMLVKRGKELHGPDRMYLNASSIVFVEPVGADSKVAQLINEANSQK